MKRTPVELSCICLILLGGCTTTVTEDSNTSQDTLRISPGEFLKLVHGTGTATIGVRDGALLKGGTWTLENQNLEFTTLGELQLQNATLQIRNSSLKLDSILYGGWLYGEDSGLELYNSTLVVQDLDGGGMTTKAAPLTIVNSSIHGIRPGPSTEIDVGATTALHARVQDFVRARFRLEEDPQDFEVHAYELTLVVAKTPFDASHAKFYAHDLKLSAAMNSRPPVMPEPLAIVGIQGQAEEIAIWGAVRLDLGSWNVTTKAGLRPPIAAQAWTEVTGPSNWPVGPALPCPRQCPIGAKVFGDAPAAHCTAPQVSREDDMNGSGEGHWLLIRTNPPPSPNQVVEFDVTIRMADAQYIFLNATVIIFDHTVFRLPWFTKLCLQDGAAPEAVVGYDLQLRTQFNEFACTEVAPDATDIEILLVQGIHEKQVDATCNLAFRP